MKNFLKNLWADPAISFSLLAIALALVSVGTDVNPYFCSDQIPQSRQQRQ